MAAIEAAVANFIEVFPARSLFFFRRLCGAWTKPAAAVAQTPSDRRSAHDHERSVSKYIERRADAKRRVDERCGGVAAPAAFGPIMRSTPAQIAPCAASSGQTPGGDRDLDRQKCQNGNRRKARASPIVRAELGDGEIFRAFADDVFYVEAPPLLI